MPLTIIPSIDLREGKVVRLKQGDYSQQTNYDVDPIEVAKNYQKDGATWLHIVDLDGAKEGRPMQTALISKIIASTGLNVQVGGGVRTTGDIQMLISAGARRVVLGTKAMEDWTWFESIVKKFENKLILALDAKDGHVAVKGWTETSDKLATDVAKQVSSWPIAAILYTDVAKDGMLQGPNIEHTKDLAEAGKVPVIASGGVGNLEHIKQLKQLPIYGAIVGKSLYEGTLKLREAIEETLK